MSGYLWKYYLEDDIESFRAVLESASISYKGSATQKSVQSALLNVGSYEQRHHEDLSSTPRAGHKVQLVGNIYAGMTLSRADLNRRDGRGRTLLHLAASSKSEYALDFAQALLDQPQVDIYLQDAESGWTALHRAFYEGKLSVAIAILTRDLQDAYGTTTVNLNHPGGLIRIKDHEGNGPFDVLEQTYEDEMRTPRVTETFGDSDSETSEEDNGRGHFDIPTIKGASTILGHEVFSFGSNKNLNLGFGDEDDRAYPERVMLRRPIRLTKHFWENMHGLDTSLSSGQIPFDVQCRPILIRDVQIGKYSSAILTADPFTNLHMCGHGSNGRLGLGDERTRFHFTCVEGGALSDQEIVAVSLGNHHTLALSKTGAVFSWGSNMFGQLGYALAKASKNEESAQLLPRQIYNPIKKEFVCGIAASASHSVLYTRSDLYTFGKNDGQLGIVDADARSLTMINIPRKVAGNKFSAAIDFVTAIDHATICLLSNREVWVYANYGYMKLSFPSTFLPNHFLRTSFTTHGAQIGSNEQRIVKIASGGDTIAAMTSTGTIFTLSVSKPTLAAQDTLSSTTNPAKIRSALSLPVAVWSNKKTRLAAKDVAVDQNGSIILSTQAGSVWRRVKRAKIKDASSASIGSNKPKDYKFSRISGLTSVNAVRASGHGAYAAVRKELQVADESCTHPSKTLRRDLLAISPFASEKILPEKSLLTQLVQQLPQQKNMIGILEQMFSRCETEATTRSHVMLCSDTSTAKIPVQWFLIAACSPILNENLHAPALSQVPQVYNLEVLDGFLHIIFKGLDLISLTNLALYIHCGHVMLHGRLSCKAYQQWNRSDKQSLIQVASQLQIKGLIDTIRTGSSKNGAYRNALEHFFQRTSIEPVALPGIDAQIVLADGSREVHSALLCQRCEFFRALFKGGHSGRWLSGRHEVNDLVQIDLNHVSTWAFDRFLHWVYSDEDAELFRDIVASDLEEFIDKIVEVLSLANELMVKPLSEICQAVLAQQVTVRNVCQILVAIAPAHVEILKQTCLEYIFLNLEAVMRHGHLDELDEDLLLELDDVAQSIQQSRSIISRTGQLEEDLLKRHPDLDMRMAIERQSKIDSIMILNKYSDSLNKGSSSYRAGSFRDDSELPSSLPKGRRRSSHNEDSRLDSMRTMKGKAPATDLMFDMDGEEKLPDNSFVMLTEHDTMAGAARTKVAPSVGGSEERGSHLAASEPHDEATRIKRSPHEPSPSTLDMGRQDARIPWTAFEPLPMKKLAMREIIDQAAVSRVSNLSLGLSKTSVSSTPSTSAIKLSQKERKKLQREASNSPAMEKANPVVDAGSSPSPWKTIPRNKINIGFPASPVESASPSTPQLTMRQTIANPVSSKHIDSKSTRSISESTPTLQTQSIPGSTVTPSKTTAHRSASMTQTPSTPTLQPHSIRHTPRPVRDVSLPEHISMSEILNQQQFDKLVAAGGGEKRSLSDIQTEQEFQEWWEKESARVQDEESNAKRDERPRRGGRGSGRSRAAGRGRGRGGSRTESSAGHSTNKQSGRSNQGDSMQSSSASKR